MKGVSMCDTEKQYKQVLASCRELFSQKLNDYSSSWRILRVTSVTDQILNKAKRIRQIEESGVALVNEGVVPEFTGLVNYSIIGLIQIELGTTIEPDISKDRALMLYDRYAQEAFELMVKKNHDYDEAWRGMRVSSMTDLILVKLFRIKQIENNKGKTEVSEGIASNYFDIMNYAIFSLIKIIYENKEA